MAQGLREQIAELERSFPKLPSGQAALLERAARELSDSGIAEKVVPAGVQAPEFTLPDAVGRPVSLAGTLAKGPAVVTFYRGIW